MAMLYPVEFVRLVASLMPKEPEVTITPVVMERMSDAQLDALIAQCIEDGLQERCRRIQPILHDQADR
jgi:hypothetical protein